jgi:hypothetical protein
MRQAIGIFSQDPRRNVTIRNGTVRGFDTGIRLGSLLPPRSTANLIESIRAIGNTRIGIAAEGRGIIIRDNHVVDTTGTSPGGIVGINVQGIGIRVINNDIANVHSSGGPSFGIDIVGGLEVPNNNLAINNRITDADFGIRYLESDGKYRDNVTSNVSTPFVGGTEHWK